MRIGCCAGSLLVFIVVRARRESPAVTPAPPLQRCRAAPYESGTWNLVGAKDWQAKPDRSHSVDRCPLTARMPSAGRNGVSAAAPLLGTGKCSLSLWKNPGHRPAKKLVSIVLPADSVRDSSQNLIGINNVVLQQYVDFSIFR